MSQSVTSDEISLVFDVADRLLRSAVQCAARCAVV